MVHVSLHVLINDACGISTCTCSGKLAKSYDTTNKQQMLQRTAQLTTDQTKLRRKAEISTIDGTWNVERGTVHAWKVEMEKL